MRFIFGAKYPVQMSTQNTSPTRKKSGLEARACQVQHIMMYWLRLCQLEIKNAVARTVCDGPYVLVGETVARLKAVTEMAQKKLKR